MTASAHTSITSRTSVMSSGVIQLGQEQQVRVARNQTYHCPSSPSSTVQHPSTSMFL